MQNLIITLLAIALFSVAAMWKINHIDVESTLVANSSEITKTDLRRVVFEITKYRILEEESPKDFDDLVSVGLMSKHVHQDGSVSFTPSFSEGSFTWPNENQIRIVDGQIGICFGGEYLNKRSKKILEFLNITKSKSLGSDGAYIESRSDNKNLVVAQECFSSEEEAIKETSPGVYRAWATYIHTGE